MGETPGSFGVLLTAGAERDLEAIYDYIATHDGPPAAAHVLKQLAARAAGLSRHPERGAFPKELALLGQREYRQVLFKPYRLIHRVFEARFVVYRIADGRRDMPSLLARRLLEF